MLGTLNRHVIFDTRATSDNCDYNTVSSSLLYYYITRQFCLKAMMTSLPLSLWFSHSLWGAFV